MERGFSWSGNPIGKYEISIIWISYLDTYEMFAINML